MFVKVITKFLIQTFTCEVEPSVLGCKGNKSVISDPHCKFSNFLYICIETSVHCQKEFHISKELKEKIWETHKRV